MAVINSSDEDAIAAINITPLVDVVLVLLVIFLVTAPVLYQSAIKVKLPQAATGESSPTPTMSFTITEAGLMSWNDEPVDWDRLSKRLKKLNEAQREETAYISADRNTPHGTVIRLMDTLRQANITHLAVSVEQSTSKDQ